LLGQSVVTAILGILFLNEALSPTDITGGLMVLIGIYLVNQRMQTIAGMMLMRNPLDCQTPLC